MLSQKVGSSDLQVAAFEESLLENARHVVGKEWKDLSSYDRFHVVSMSVRDRLLDRRMETEERYRQSDAKRLYYLSMEFLMGRSLGNNLFNLGAFEACREALEQLGVDLDEVRETEPDAALGNGGLGRLAACFLDSLATLDMPGYGYGINYEYGLFKQEIRNGYQKEDPDHWLAYGTPWQIRRPDDMQRIPVYGKIEGAPSFPTTRTGPTPGSSSACRTTCRSSATAAAPSISSASTRRARRKSSTWRSLTAATT